MAAVRPEPEPPDTNALESWLTARLPGARAVRLGEFDRCTLGYSAETFVVPATVERDAGTTDERFVLRREVPGPPVYPTQVPGLEVEIDIQYRAMDAVARTSTAPIAPLIGYEHDPAIFGDPFFVMGFVDGVVPVVEPPYTRTGFFADAAPADRRALIEDGLRVLGELHRIDWRDAGLDWLVPAGVAPGTATQLEVWSTYLRRELGDRSHPLLDDALTWLHANVPTDEPVGLCWGDARPGNMIWRDFRCVCVTDFEAVSIAPPEIDLGWWLMFDRWSHEAAGQDRLPGEPTRDEQRAFYTACTGREVGDMYFHELFAALRYAAIHVRVMNRSVERGHMSPDHTIWRDNGAVDCIAALLTAGR